MTGVVATRVAISKTFWRRGVAIWKISWDTDRHSLYEMADAAWHGNAYAIADAVFPFERFRFWRIETSSNDVLVAFVHVRR